MILINDLFFFFSSRRRHTRLQCDWSSDVCSSDLSWRRTRCACGPARRCPRASSCWRGPTATWPTAARSSSSAIRTARSEERRVGEESSGGGAQEHEEEKSKNDTNTKDDDDTQKLK